MITIAEFTDVAYEVTDGVAVITINRPDRYNAMRGRTVDEFLGRLGHLGRRRWLVPGRHRRRTDLIVEQGQQH